MNPDANGRFEGQRVNLGGYGFGGPPLFAGRAATGILGEGIHVRAFALTGATGGAFAIADIETPGLVRREQRRALRADRHTQVPR